MIAYDVFCMNSKHQMIYIIIVLTFMYKLYNSYLLYNMVYVTANAIVTQSK